MLATPALLSLPAWVWAGSRRRDTRVDSTLAVFSHDASARVIGQAFLAAHGEAGDIGRLRASLGADLDDPLLPPDPSPARIRECVRQRCARDFEQHRMYKLNGCWFAITELRLCALMVLADPTRSTR